VSITNNRHYKADISLYFAEIIQYKKASVSIEKFDKVTVLDLNKILASTPQNILSLLHVDAVTQFLYRQYQKPR